MNGGLKPSGVSWLGDIPHDWQTTRIISTYAERSTKVSDKDYPPLTVGKMGVVPQLEHVAKTDDGDNRKLVKKDDFVINSRADRRGACGIAEQDGSVSLINIVLQPLKHVCNRYYSFVFRSERFADEFFRLGNGIVDDLWTTRWYDMKKIYIPVPSETEQQMIADFLDEECAKIDAIVADMEKQVEILEQCRKSVVDEVIRNGGGTEKRLKDLFIFGRGAGISKEFMQEQGLPCIHYGGIHFSYGFSVAPEKDEVWCVDETWAKTAPNSLLKRGDFLFADTSEDIEGSGNFTCYESDRQAIAGQGCIIIRPIEKFISRYMAYQFDSLTFRQQIRTEVFGVKVFHPTQAIIKKCNIVVPPITEQQAIADYLDKKCAKIDALIKDKQAAVDTMREYKKSLIYEYVTGKKRVKEAQ